MSRLTDLRREFMKDYGYDIGGIIVLDSAIEAQELWDWIVANFEPLDDE